MNALASLRLRLSFLVILIDGLLATSPTAWAKEPRVDLTVRANVKAVVPGEPFQVAFQFDIESKWHIYWKNSGDSGLPPQVKWQLPDGFAASSLAHQAPRSHVDAGGLVSFIHEGQPVLTATVIPPPDLRPGRKIEIKGDLVYLVCRESCIRSEKPFKLSLPVAALGSPPQADNADLFTAARAARPQPGSAAKYAQVKPLLDVDRVRPKDKFKLGVVLEIDKGYHIQSHKPLAENFIATEAFPERVSQINLGRAAYPEHQVRTLPGGMKMAEYSGRVVVQFDAEADNTLPTEPLRFAGVVRYQACDAVGRCFPPQSIEWELSVPTAHEGDNVQQINREYFAAAPTGQEHEPAGSAATKADEPATTQLGTEPPVSSTPGGRQPVVVDASAQPAWKTPERGLAWYLFAGALGGLILNIMPCVLPVISIKILSFVQQGGEHPRRVFHLGLAFAAGIMVSFLLLAVLVIFLQRFLGVQVGWGFQLSNPYAVIFFSGIIFLFGLSLFGVFEINLPGQVSAKLGAAEAREGLAGSFMKGVLATILATPCTAPFLGSAVGWAFSQHNDSRIVMVILAVGAGMALPYVLLTAQPVWLKHLPKPGAWMEKFKQFMGFVIIGTVVWLFLTLGDLIGPRGLVWTIGFCCFLALAAWMLGWVNFTMSKIKQWSVWGSALTVILIGWVFCFGFMFDIDKALAENHLTQTPPQFWRTMKLPVYEDGGSIPWQPWSPGLPKQLAASGFTVYVDYTATWCPTCQTNKKLVVETPEVWRKMWDLGVYPIKADYTAQPPAMTAELRRYGRSGVPLNIILPAGKPESATVLPEQLVGYQQLVLDKLDQAGPSTNRQTQLSAEIHPGLPREVVESYFGEGEARENGGYAYTNTCDVTLVIWYAPDGTVCRIGFSLDYGKTVETESDEKVECAP